MADDSITQIVENKNSTEEELWHALTEAEEESVSWVIMESLFDHPNCSDRIVHAYFTGAIPFDPDSMEERGDRLEEQFFWWDVDEVVNVKGLSVQTREIIIQSCAQRMRASCYYDVLEGAGQSLVYYSWDYPDELLGEDISSEVLMHDVLSPAVTLIECLKIAGLEEEYSGHVQDLEHLKLKATEILIARAKDWASDSEDDEQEE
jgi:hypothetical protein